MKRKINSAIIVLYILIIMLIVSTIYFIIQSNNRQKQLYQMCRQFDFMAYLTTENIRHYQNSSYELNEMPNCEVYNNNYTNGGHLTYDEWLLENNLTHINWKNNSNGN